MIKLELIKNAKLSSETFFNKKELQEILNLYARMVSMGEWKDYGIYMGKNIVSFEIYRKATERPLFQIVKKLQNKDQNKYMLQDSSGIIIKSSNNLSLLIKIISSKQKIKHLKVIK